METIERTHNIPFTAPRRFQGPDGIANGGWLSGRLAAHFPEGDPVEVVLRAPTPVGRPLSTDLDGRRVQVRDGAKVLAEATPATYSPLPPPAVAWGAAGLASAEWVGWWDHPLPGCFVCGHRRADDGLRIFPGPVAGRPGTVACTWTPDPAHAGPDGIVPAEVVWAALDCPTAWPHLRPGRVALLARIVGRVPGVVRAGEDYLVVGEATGHDGRRRTGRAGIYDREGRVIGASSALWIEVVGA